MTCINYPIQASSEHTTWPIIPFYTSCQISCQISRIIFTSHDKTTGPKTARRSRDTPNDYPPGEKISGWNWSPFYLSCARSAGHAHWHTHNLSRVSAAASIGCTFKVLGRRCIFAAIGGTCGGEVGWGHYGGSGRNWEVPTALIGLWPQGWRFGSFPRLFMSIFRPPRCPHQLFPTTLLQARLSSVWN